MIEKVIFYDSDFLVSFILIDEVSFLKKVFLEIIIPDVVYDELTYDGTPNKIKNKITQLKNEGFVKIESIEVLSPEYYKYLLIKRGNWHENGKLLDNGESAALALVIENDGVLASNNLDDVKYYVDKYELPLLTSSYLLGLSVENNIISYDDANKMWDKMNKENRKLPKDTFSDYYCSLYSLDYEDFGHRLFDE